MDNSIFLQEYCQETGCGGQIHRQIERTNLDQDDNGGQLCCAQIFDRCADCGTIRRQSPRANFPCLGLDDLFEQWGKGQLSRPEFDSAVVQALAKGGTYWKINAS